jgi:hypothetical protein
MVGISQGGELWRLIGVHPNLTTATPLEIVSLDSVLPHFGRCPASSMRSVAGLSLSRPERSRPTSSRPGSALSFGHANDSLHKCALLFAPGLPPWHLLHCTRSRLLVFLGVLVLGSAAKPNSKRRDQDDNQTEATQDNQDHQLTRTDPIRAPQSLKNAR